VPAEERMVDVPFVGYEPRCHGASYIRCCPICVSRAQPPPGRRTLWVDRR
jgi:hypothetical protein